MKTKLPTRITTVVEAEKFLKELHKNGEHYHPEDSAHEIIWNIYPPPNTKECDLLDKLMEDIYNLKGNDGRHCGKMIFCPCAYLNELDNTKICKVKDKRKKTFKKQFLLYTIQNTWNGDGYVLVDEGCSQGNFSSLEDAERYTVLYFMASHPREYKANLIYRAMGHGGCSHEWFTLRDHLKRLGIPMPEELKDYADGINFMIGYNGTELYKTKNKD